MASWTCECGAANPMRRADCVHCHAARPSGAGDTALAVSERAKCSSCGPRRDAEPGCAGKCEDCYTCHGQTALGRCRFRATLWVESQGMCLWHRRILGREAGRFNTFEEFERFCAAMAGKYCGPWTHWTPSVLWDGMAGRVMTLPPPTWCGQFSCDFAPEPGARPMPALSALAKALPPAPSGARVTP